jgi:hypothetical protein
VNYQGTNSSIIGARVASEAASITSYLRFALIKGDAGVGAECPQTP